MRVFLQKVEKPKWNYTYFVAMANKAVCHAERVEFFISYEWFCFSGTLEVSGQ